MHRIRQLLIYIHLTAGVKERAAEALENAFGFKE